MNKELLRVALRQSALYLPDAMAVSHSSSHALALITELRSLGFTLSEQALHAVNGLSDDEGQQLLDVMNDVMGTHLNWAALVRGWLVPTGEGAWDHFITLIANLRLAPRRQMSAETANDEGEKSATAVTQQPFTGTTLPCGHLIPDGTFPLERYTGCPFCGRPFCTDNHTFRGQGTKLKTLQLWGNDELNRYFRSLLLSPVPLDATQRESLKVLMHNLSLPADVDIVMKETRMIVADELVATGRDDEAGRLMASPADVMRYLWYRHTGHVQLLEPRTLVKVAGKNHRHERLTAGDVSDREAEERQRLRLKYDRRWCRRVAQWLNTMDMDTDQQLESMHPKRQMWVRFIRALRLAEYAKREGYDRLRVLMDRFYRSDYHVWQGRVDHFRQRNNGDETLRLLQQRPGLFARCLFSTMLTFGGDAVVSAFQRVIDRVPVRLLLALGSQSQLYFCRDAKRVARPLSGVMQPIGPHPLLVHYTDDELQHMQQAVQQLYLDAMRRHFAAAAPPSGQQPSPENVDDTTPYSTKKASHHQCPTPYYIYIDPELYHIPVAVGDRSASIQDVSAALQGQRFHVDGDNIRLFLQWGKDLPAQPMDMDLSCFILSDTEAEACSYFNLVTVGAKHSGDIREIPDMVGTAEYVELSLPDLLSRGARRVVFTCNAYSSGNLSPNLTVGWMSADQPMTVSNETGVAYDPSTVQHMVRISESNLAKGLVFGVLDVSQREITWLEMPFDGQTVLSITPQTIDDYLHRLQAKPTIGQLLDIKAEVQHMQHIDTPDGADEAYTLLWAQNSAEVARLLMG